MFKFITNTFAKDEDGAVSVDWVVLSAAIVGVAAGALSQTQNATVALADSISSEMISIQVGE